MTKVSDGPVPFLPPYRPRGPRGEVLYEDEGTIEDILKNASDDEASTKKPPETPAEENS